MNGGFLHGFDQKNLLGTKNKGDASGYYFAGIVVGVR